MNPAVIVEEVLRFEDLPVGSTASRRAVVRWSDGTDGEALRWFGDEILVCEGDVIGKTREQIRSLHFRRDRDWMWSCPQPDADRLTAIALQTRRGRGSATGSCFDPSSGPSHPVRVGGPNGRSPTAEGVDAWPRSTRATSAVPSMASVVTALSAHGGSRVTVKGKERLASG